MSTKSARVRSKVAGKVLRKTAIAVPATVLDAVDEIATQRHESRSAFITRVLRAALQARHDEEITQRLREVFANPELRAEQLQSANDLESVGVDWSDERW